MKKCLTVLITLVITIMCCTAFAETEVQIKKIEIKEKSIKLAPDTIYQVSITINPENATETDLVWTSSNNDVATVDEFGIVRGIKKGTAKITVASSGKSNAKATVTVTVQEYDLIFKSRKSQKIKYSFGSGQVHLKASAKNGNVSLSPTEQEIMAFVGKEKREEEVEVTPINPGEDIITIKVNSQKSTYKIYVSQEAFNVPSETPGYIAEEDGFLFMNIPWGATYSEAKKILLEQGIDIPDEPARDGYSYVQKDSIKKVQISGKKPSKVELYFTKATESDPLSGKLYKVICNMSSSGLSKLKEYFSSVTGVEFIQKDKSKWIWEKGNESISLNVKSGNIIILYMCDGIDNR